MRLDLTGTASERDRTPAGSSRALFAEPGQCPADSHPARRGSDCEARQFRLAWLCDYPVGHTRNEQDDRAGYPAPLVDDEDLAVARGIDEVASV